MNDYNEKDTFEFGVKLNETTQEFEVQNEPTNESELNKNQNEFTNSFHIPMGMVQSNGNFDSETNNNLYETNEPSKAINEEELEESSNAFGIPFEDLSEVENESVPPVGPGLPGFEELKQPIDVLEVPFEVSNEIENNEVPPVGPGLPGFEELKQPIDALEVPFEVSNEIENKEVPPVGPELPGFDELKYSEVEEKNNIDNEFFSVGEENFGNVMNDEVEFEVVEPKIVSPSENIKQEQSKIVMSDTPIEELNKLTEYKEQKVDSTDIKSLFNRVGINVQEASDIFIKNTEMKEIIDAKFEELKKLQNDLDETKKKQYDEINSYKEEVFNKLTEKKEEIEKRIDKLKEIQTDLENKKNEFEKYKKEQTEEIQRVQQEVQDAYESRREELNHIEDVLRKQKDTLDEERSQLSLDRIQYESDKNELANNLLKFNEIVDSFTSGMENAGKQDI